jgi:hypothetical protein
MLTCIYHPIYPMRVVEEDEADDLKASGFWFDSPAKAKEYRAKVENDIKLQENAKVISIVKPKNKGRQRH